MNSNLVNTEILSKETGLDSLGNTSCIYPKDLTTQEPVSTALDDINLCAEISPALSDVEPPKIKSPKNSSPSGNFINFGLSGNQTNQRDTTIPIGQSHLSEVLNLEYLASYHKPIEFNYENNNVEILVTGATGFIASHIVERLLLRGYKVRGTIRSLESSTYNYLEALPYAKQNLRLVEANLLNSSIWNEVIKDCQVVIHCASPYSMDFNDPYVDIINPAVEGTKNVIDACCLCNDVKTVVLTSSIAAIVGDYENGKVYSEADWNEVSNPLIEPYLYSKTAAERLAHRTIDEQRPDLNLIVVNVGMTIGPSFRTDINQSVQWIYDMISGGIPTLVDFQTGWIDVRDVAEIHIRLFETKESHGRYICVQGMHTLQDIARIIKVTKPHLKTPSIVIPTFLAKLFISLFTSKSAACFLKKTMGKHILISNAKLVSHLSDYKFIPIEESLTDTCTDLQNKFKIQSSLFSFLRS
ncbi:NAD dependent epimerase/dehydratase family protein [Cryptosporidium muris RN66]|uniref:NAD dependent epimerase/dehydratase family protein n=1 Tax=Cryptosporidium muris (strain RN66) TaxID=441375 RepID=B6A9W4_CRYMR|nr:NAD dependent epimerase/dehydratase family protein [Cryptosporidium muris RN66]EEA05005.1 NAD dependent epimerase/dehydratase family protein [Cryptosporidium muris RN66]|eukprot:XP_002139354.1 NAD dependent epimerase/dehydratase family protein [Cryptosporidium muris RN66]